METNKMSVSDAAVLLNVPVTAFEDDVKVNYTKKIDEQMRTIGFNNPKEESMILEHMDRLHKAALTLYPGLASKIEYPISAPFAESLMAHLGKRVAKLFKNKGGEKKATSGKSNTYISPEGVFVQPEVTANRSSVYVKQIQKETEEKGQQKTEFIKNSTQGFFIFLYKVWSFIIKQSIPKINLFKAIILFQILFGLIALCISTYFEYITFNQMFHDPSGKLDPVIPYLHISISFPMIMVFECTKAIAIVAIPYFKVSGKTIGKTLSVLLIIFRAMLITISICCTMALVFYYLYNEPLKEARHRQINYYDSLHNINLDKINQEYLIEIRPIDSVLNFQQRSSRGRVWNTFNGYKEQLKSKRNIAQREADEKHKREITEENINIEVLKLNTTGATNEITKAINDGFKKLGIPIDYGVLVVLFSLLIACLIELSIYISFNMAVMEFVKKN